MLVYRIKRLVFLCFQFLFVLFLFFTRIEPGFNEGYLIIPCNKSFFSIFDDLSHCGDEFLGSQDFSKIIDVCLLDKSLQILVRKDLLQQIYANARFNCFLDEFRQQASDLS